MTEDTNKKTAEEESGDEMKKLEEIPAGAKICPFMNSYRRGVICTPDCALHRADKKDNECVFCELQSISYFLKKMAENKSPNRQ